MIYLFLAEGFEEIEAVTVIDCLRRSNLEVLTVGVGGNEIKGSHGISIKADITDDKIVISKEIQAIVLPGGLLGVQNLEKSYHLKKCIEYCNDNSIYIAAICAAPSLLGKYGILKGKEATCYPGFEKYLKEASVSDKDCLISENIITGKSPAFSFDFSFLIVESILGKSQAEALRSGLLWKK